MTECFDLYLPNVSPVNRDFNSIHAVLSEFMNSLDCSDSYSTFTNMQVLNIHIQEYTEMMLALSTYQFWLNMITI